MPGSERTAGTVSIARLKGLTENELFAPRSEEVPMIRNGTVNLIPVEEKQRVLDLLQEVLRFRIDLSITSSRWGLSENKEGVGWGLLLRVSTTHRAASLRACDFCVTKACKFSGNASRFRGEIRRSAFGDYRWRTNPEWIYSSWSHFCSCNFPSSPRSFRR